MKKKLTTLLLLLAAAFITSCAEEVLPADVPLNLPDTTIEVEDNKGTDAEDEPEEVIANFPKS